MKSLKQSLLLACAFVLFFSFTGSAFASQKETTPLDEWINELLGTDYKYGGTTEEGFDCSGFTSYVFKQFDIALARTSKSQAAEGEKVSKKNLRKGDLVFFNTNGKSISHVGIYIGGGEFAHSSSKHGVTINDINDDYYVKTYVTARRILSEEQFKEIAAVQE